MLDDTRPSKVMDNRAIPSDWWRSVVPLCEYSREGDLDSIELLPITLGEDAPRAQRGIPTFASDLQRDQFAGELRTLSEEFDTHLTVEGDTIVVETS